MRRVISKKEFAERMGRSVRHLERMIAIGEGPPIIQLGERRVGIEHRLAHIVSRQGPRARYLGIRKNRYDLRRAAAIQNLETIQRGGPLGRAA